MKNSSSIKHINHTGTFKVESTDTRNQSIDKYGNEVREFIIDHPNLYGFQTNSSKNQNNNGSQRFMSTDSYDNKENMAHHNIVIDPQQYCDFNKITSSTRNDIKVGSHFKYDENRPQPSSQLITNRNGNFKYVIECRKLCK